MSTESITVSVDDLVEKVNELQEAGVSFVKLTIVGDSYDSELSMEAYDSDDYPINFGEIPAHNDQEN